MFLNGIELLPPLPMLCVSRRGRVFASRMLTRCSKLFSVSLGLTPLRFGVNAVEISGLTPWKTGG